MGALKLNLHCGSQRVDGIAADPEPDWSFDALVSELNALETKLASTSSVEPSHFAKTMNEVERSRGFILRAHEYEMEDTESDDDDDDDDKALVVDSYGKRFTCDELYLSDSDDSDIVSGFEVQPYLMDEAGELEGALFELTQEHHLRVKDEIRNKISALETALMNESQNSTSSLLLVEKYKETRQELDKKFDTQYQRRIAEALDNHLTAVQQDRELRSQIEERKIRSDAAYEEAKRKVAFEKQQQEKAKAEAEAKLRAEEAKRVALEAERKAEMEVKRKAAMEAEKRAAAEAERRAEKEAVERDVPETSKRVTAGATQQGAAGHPTDTASSLANANTKESGNVYRAAGNALNLEHERLQKLKELYERNKATRSSYNKDYTRHEGHISRNIRQIRGIRDNVRSKATELIKLLNDPHCPQSISVEIFAKKVVSYCENPGNAPFASAYVIVLVTSQFPYAMDILLAELHMACLYTVPKHLVYKKSTFPSKEAYFRSIGYREDEKMESTEDYLKRLESYMKVYGALVQTEIPNVQNLHGLQEGWAWLARFLNTLPANQYTAVSLNAFLQMAGFGLFKRYKSQFLKMLNIVSENFLVDLKSRNIPELTRTVTEIQTYIEDKKYLQEPEGRSLQSNLLSSVYVNY
ncbi:protein GLE1 isoform X2 [Abrus precatorius]|uniref:mRNA export factor GLE1 n=1 Tax=Abrus precatorius TaxID=3816 RepID=A0A8B8JYU8_ABRPR|nr:protein GLE1 isoform X2 [Abrus precatorius]